MQFLSIVSTFAPYSYGGAEVSARNLMNWSLKKGHKIAVYTMSPTANEEQFGEDFEGIEVWRRKTEKPYPYWENASASKLNKLEYYAKDHMDPRNLTRMSDVLDKVKPDAIFMHVIAGLGWNAAREIARRNIPTIYFMHDLNLLCANGGMFKDGANCEGWCGSCRMLSKMRFDVVSEIPRVGFCSPSLANFEKAAQFLPLKNHHHAVIPNPNVYPQPLVEHTETSTLRVVYVGRIHLTKGIDVLIQACDQVAGEAPISLTVIGDGPESDALKARWGAKPWVTFMGRLVHQQISDLMKQSDVLSAPSIWPENYPGVVAHALGQGLPVIGSDIGGIPELVRDDVNGFLVPPGNVDALRRALGKLAKDRQCLNRIKRQTEGQKALFDPERNAERIFAFAEQLRTGVVSYA